MTKLTDSEKHFLEQLEGFHSNSQERAILSFPTLWTDSQAHRKHIRKRVKEGSIENEWDYLLKTFEVLSHAEVFYIETYPKELEIWTRTFYHRENSWAVVLGENGKILTSYKIRDDIIKTLEKHKVLFDSHYNRKEVSDEFSKTIKQIYERLTRV